MNYPYTSGIVKSLENKLLNREKLYRLAKIDKNDFVKVLKEMDYGTQSSKTLEEVLHDELLKVKNLIDSITPESKYSNLFYLNHDNLNTKLLYKNLFFDVSASDLLTDLGSIDAEKIAKIILENDYSNLTKKEEKLFKGLKEISFLDKSARYLSTEIDKAYYKFALSCAKFNPVLVRYYKVAIDNSNILMFIRTKLLGWSIDEFLSMAISDGNISLDDLERFYFLSDELLLKEIEKYYEGRLTNILKNFFKVKDLSKIERDLDQLLIDIVSLDRNDALGIGPLLYYYLAKMYEIKNIRMIYSDASVQLNDLLVY